MACCPGGISAAAASFLAKGDAPLSVAMTTGASMSVCQLHKGIFFLSLLLSICHACHAFPCSTNGALPCIPARAAATALGAVVVTPLLTYVFLQTTVSVNGVMLAWATLQVQHLRRWRRALHGSFARPACWPSSRVLP